MSFFADLANTDYANLMSRLMPRGKAMAIITTETGLKLSFRAYGEELARVHNRLLDLIEESDPRTTTELIDGWERVLGLPDPCDPSPPTTLADRRLAAHAKFIARGGSQKGILMQVIAAAGYDGTDIQLPELFRADESASDERGYDDTWVWVWFVWRATTPPQGWTRLQCLLDRIKPSHTSANLIDGLEANEVALPT